jgi:hypothetical protein
LHHFKAKQIVGSQTPLGETFAELRFHLVMAGRESELSVNGKRFGISMILIMLKRLDKRPAI